MLSSFLRFSYGGTVRNTKHTHGGASFGHTPHQLGGLADLLLLALALADPLLGGLAWAQDLRPVPPLTERVIDQTGTLSSADSARLIDKLAAFERDAGPQIVVLMVPTTQPEDIASYAQRETRSMSARTKDC
jgi:uncharacterized membrane protein YgcG